MPDNDDTPSADAASSLTKPMETLNISSSNAVVEQTVKILSIVKVTLAPAVEPSKFNVRQQF